MRVLELRGGAAPVGGTGEAASPAPCLITVGFPSAPHREMQTGGQKAALLTVGGTNVVVGMKSTAPRASLAPGCFVFCSDKHVD